MFRVRGDRAEPFRGRARVQTCGFARGLNDSIVLALCELSTQLLA
jgi:hypothetical protein